MADIPILSLEEHFLDPVTRNSQTGPDHFANFPAPTMDKLGSLGSTRLASMSSAGVALQVLSHVPLDPTPEVAGATNDRLAAAIAAHPTRFAGFATLPLCDPHAAADELKRCVQTLGFAGALVDAHHRGRTYDDKDYWPVFEAAQSLDCVVYVHPAFPAEGAWAEHYEGNYGKDVAMALGAFGLGWHSETALAFLKMFAAGLFEEFPRIKVVLGHMGEGLPFFLDRIYKAAARWGRQRSLEEVWNENVWVTTSGIFSLAPLSCLLQTTKIGRILFSVDYPFSENQLGRDFLVKMQKSGLLTKDELEGIAYRHAETLLKLKIARD
ncbi:putative 2-amino-3-carboxymuconate-6-semialdehyde decarboxylase [Microstroma glucosiphilum]|uniref:Putative 2-amino-3-carboxymuconate-6-semialdehyde decarboxylase n=1 Tax=Pseudomicrostroma glucosiphilum TaxID=1684307 RepID=A0A316U129_9BASI|nr:putative 2-amino-3-carboxymuconate-6-semialdehyde decarboxylase [Pseudomicrostroma glucosiphilum]PWN18183.1 putative 2-amino-3-carboxymuconate-6-semialdehyde decarboxylase [Pseudomicrostroma glucosiphilum]